jgi:hypothetical protein
METQKEYHYTYYSYEEWGRGYFGSRTCKCLPEEDVKYFGSFYDKNFKPTQKIILKGDYNTRAEADADEILLHDYFKVDINPHFANQAKQTSTKFTTNGMKRPDLVQRNMQRSGEKRSDEFRQKMSSVTKGEKNGMYGKKRPDLAERNRKRRGRKIQYNENGLKSKQKSAKLVNSQKWECCITGYISTAAGVVSYQKGRGIDTSKNNRRRIA